jgi:hypothetical protein
LNLAYRADVRYNLWAFRESGPLQHTGRGPLFFVSPYFTSSLTLAFLLDKPGILAGHFKGAFCPKTNRRGRKEQLLC